MSTLLVLNSSALGTASVSKQLIGDTVARLRAQNPGLKVVERDIGLNPIPHLTADSATAIRGGEPANDAQAQARTLSDTLIDELKAADIVVIGAPMYNFGIPSTLKAWFDYVLRAGVTFKYGDAGPEGLLKGKRAIVVESRGGLYSSGPAQPMDSQEPHLRTMLGFAGISDVTFVRAEKLGYGPEAREQSINAAQAELKLVA
ncbi:FMN-dependent NADH-azoreductase [Bosea caraganae]|uniref:FMN dependent NADH:quinone oxidoreductase n=1 Tax=Bosea caraganae TaxID=2763117 RepID=A0A370LAD3_9HYPH|nr:FMN-dependent NADH-azoreductase [Bosea caraganae]RDJ21685.1 FMN-dependent NADH-azoreductase [Bosea caraganae]RDJ28284.1 FMN-dependent NADH-azoreductase [Bosea caraganae]